MNCTHGVAESVSVEESVVHGLATLFGVTVNPPLVAHVVVKFSL